jgi:hypothetical protein
MTTDQPPVAVYLVHVVDDRTGLAVCSDVRPATFPANDTRTPRQLCPGCSMVATGWRRL